jgi:diacylglycerol kinase
MNANHYVSVDGLTKKFGNRAVRISLALAVVALRAATAWRWNRIDWSYFRTTRTKK